MPRRTSDPCDKEAASPLVAQTLNDLNTMPESAWSIILNGQCWRDESRQHCFVHYSASFVTTSGPT